MPLFKKTRMLEMKMDEFLDVTSESGMVFLEGITQFMEGKKDDFEASFRKIKKQENRADVLRREIESQLYTETLIPESRGDVLALLETTDDVINQAKDTLMEFSVAHPDIPEKYRSTYIELADRASRAVDEVAKAIRSFLRDPMGVRDFLHKVHHYESESDSISEKLRREIYNSDLDLSLKYHLRLFAVYIDQVADKAEDVADRLAIYSIKRAI